MYTCAGYVVFLLWSLWRDIGERGCVMVKSGYVSDVSEFKWRKVEVATWVGSMHAFDSFYIWSGLIPLLQLVDVLCCMQG